MGYRFSHGTNSPFEIHRVIHDIVVGGVRVHKRNLAGRVGDRLPFLASKCEGGVGGRVDGWVVNPAPPRPVPV